MSPEVRTATPDDKERALDTLVLAFAQDPMMRWAFPDPSAFLTGFPQFALAFGGLAFDHQSAHSAGRFAGTALWLPPGIEPDEEAMGAVVQSVLDESRIGTALKIQEEMSRYHPEEPLWYLPLMGVEPAQQRRGIGGALMAHALRFIDEQQSLAYLESSNPENIPLYERHGFEVLGTIQVDDSPVLTPMLRRPL
jgi:ribosomal protein S18 acetylase RimI-like enzyme